MNKEQQPHDQETDAPPGFKSWNSWYVLLIATLVVLIGLFYALTQGYS